MVMWEGGQRASKIQPLAGLSDRSCLPGLGGYVHRMTEHNIPRPRLACEITADAVVSARAGDSGKTLEAAAARKLPDGAVTPGLIQANISAREALLSALRETLAAVSGRSSDL